jgi:hypothetical protein
MGGRRRAAWLLAADDRESAAAGAAINQVRSRKTMNKVPRFCTTCSRPCAIEILRPDSNQYAEVRCPVCGKHQRWLRKPTQSAAPASVDQIDRLNDAMGRASRHASSLVDIDRLRLRSACILASRGDLDYQEVEWLIETITSWCDVVETRASDLFGRAT